MHLLSIVIPTRNEEKNIQKLIDAGKPKFLFSMK